LQRFSPGGLQTEVDPADRVDSAEFFGLRASRLRRGWVGFGRCSRFL